MTVTQREFVDKVSFEQDFINKCVITFKMADCKFSKLQKERFLFLVGPRYDAKTDTVKFVGRHFTEYEYNYNKAVEMIKEVLLESYRAPLDEEDTSAPFITTVTEA